MKKTIFTCYLGVVFVLMALAVNCKKAEMKQVDPRGKWVLTLNLSSWGMGSQDLTLNFAGDGVSGPVSSPDNYNGTYQVNGDSITIKLTDPDSGGTSQWNFTGELTNDNQMKGDGALKSTAEGFEGEYKFTWTGSRSGN